LTFSAKVVQLVYMTQEQLDVIEEYALYKSGLYAYSSDDGFNCKVKEAVKEYGRIIIDILEKQHEVIE